MSRNEPPTEDGRVESAVLRHLRRRDYRAVPQRRLLHQMQVPGERRAPFREAIQRLRERGAIVKMRGGRLALARREGRTVGRHSVLGVFTSRGRGGEVRSFDPLLPHAIHVPAAFRLGARDAEVVRVEVLRGPGEGRAAEGKILEQLGPIDRPGMDLEVVTRQHHLRSDFPAAVLGAAAELPSRPGSEAKRDRTRFDDPPPVTIDGATAQDFDDAIAVEQRPGGGFRLYVHIADVAHFVPEGGVIDREALLRGTSVYFPGHVLPMLPEKLSNDLCSLRPGVDRLVQSVIIDVDARGKMGRVRFADGIIRSAARLTYDQVAAVAEDEGRIGGVPARVRPMLDAAHRLRKLLESKRLERGSVDCDLPEPTILLDVAGEMTGIRVEPRNRAHRMIEEFMLLANEAVARQLESRLGLCLYRVHEQPDAAKLELLSHFVAGFGIRTSFSAESISPRDVQQLLTQAAGRPESRLINQVTLRTMKRARYTTENIGHFGLALPIYTHFTSPIRRYPDLVVHRLLREARGRARPIDEVRRERFEEIAERCSDLERAAEAAERELLAWKKIAFIRGRTGERFRGVITGVARFGLFVQLEENLVEGLLKVELLGGERFEYLDRRMELKGLRSGRRYRLGDRLEVRLDRVDPILKRVDFSIAEGQPRPPATGGGSARRRRRPRSAKRSPGGVE